MTIQEQKSESLSKQAFRGTFWTLLSNIAVSVVSFVGTAILARILEPRDFGFLGMAGLVAGIIGLFNDVGLSSALVQRKNVSSVELSTVFWANCIVSTVLVLFCILIAPLVGVFFREPAAGWILIFLSFNFILTALGSVQNALIYKHLKMKSLVWISVGGRVLRVVITLVTAFCGMSFWSILIGMIVERLFKTTALFLIHPWRPALVFSVQKFKEMFKFGRNILGSGFLVYFNQNMDFIVTGRVLGASSLGFYQMAYNLPHLLQGYVNDSIGAVAFPVFCKVQDDAGRLAKGFIKIVQYVSIGIFPFLAGLAFTAHDFILVAYGEKWLPTVIPLQILCFVAALSSVNTVVAPLLNAKGRPGLGFQWGCARLPVTIIAIITGIHWGGIVGVSWGMLTVEVLFLGMIYHVFRLLNSNIIEYWKALLPATGASLVMVAVLFITNKLFLVYVALASIRLLIEVVIGAFVYFVVISVGYKAVFNDFLEFVKKSRGAKD